MKKYLYLILIGLMQMSSLHGQLNTYTYDYDNAGNRTNLNSLLSCDNYCSCPYQADEWLVLSTEIGTTECGAGKCRITAQLNIPPEYSCYKYFRYDIGEGESQQFSPITSITNNEWCINTGESLTLTVYLYRSLVDTDPCIISKEAGCDLECCNYINVNFIPIASSDPNYCCWMPNITTDDGAVCDLSDVSIELFDAFGSPITLGTNGELCRPLSYHQSNSPILQKKIRYKISVYGEQCGDFRDVVLICGGCDCPSEKVLNSWAKLNLDKYDPTCPAGECKVTAKLEIPEIYKSCYTSYKIAYKMSDGTQVNYGTNLPKPIPMDGILTDLPNCIPAGVSLMYSVYLYGSNTICEVISNDVFCSRIENNERPNSCDPNGDPWLGFGTVIVSVNGCNYVVNYQYRKTAPPDLYQDVQLLSVEALDDNCPNVNVEDIFIQALPNAISKIIDSEEEFKPQHYDSQPCYDMWRVFQNSCWTKWRCFDGVAEFNTWLPCQSECCSRKLRVCQTQTGISVEDIGFATGSGSFNCSLAQLQPGVIPINSSQQQPNCEDKNCDVYNDISIDVHMPYNHRNYTYHDLTQISHYKFQNESKLDVFKFRHQFNISNNTLNVLIAESEYDNTIINILDLSGKILISKKFELTKSEQTIKLDIESLSSGSYFYNILSKGLVIGTGNFIYVK